MLAGVAILVGDWLMLRCVLLFTVTLLSLPVGASAQSCAGSPVAVQILGSGGPNLNAERASASYLLWVGNQAKVLVDMGGGAYLRFGQSGAKLDDLAMVGISHLHPDHVSDLPAFFWTNIPARKNTLPIVGPSGNDVAPDFAVFLSRLFDPKTGAFEVLGPVLGATPANGGTLARLEISVVDVKKPEASTVFDREGLTVTAFSIPHGNLPALAYRVKTGDVSVVFSTDQNGTNPKFVDFAKGANILVMHMAIAAGATSPLHAAPAVVGRVAREANVGRLIVSHIGRYDLDAALTELKTSYAGPLTVGSDLQCTQVQ
jgi:ribonuclease BN (tRNA processing enzyme)